MSVAINRKTVEPRDSFDGLLASIPEVLLYIRLVRPSLAGEQLDTVADALLSLYFIFYMVLAAVLGVGSLCYPPLPATEAQPAQPADAVGSVAVSPGPL